MNLAKVRLKIRGNRAPFFFFFPAQCVSGIWKASWEGFLFCFWLELIVHLKDKV